MHRVVDKADVCSSVCVDIGKFLDDLHLRKHRGREGSTMLESKQQLHLVEDGTVRGGGANVGTGDFC